MNIFETIKESLSFKDIASHYGIEFNPSGKAACPFHKEKDPSFSLHPSGLYAKCFGCGVAVDLIEIEYRLGKHDSRWEAAKALNDRYSLGLKFEGFDKEKAEEISAAHRLLSSYCEQTHMELLENKEALSWLEEHKGITVEDVKQYCIGYVGHGWLKDGVTEKNRTPFLKIGLLRQKDGKIYDAFWHRLIFPVCKHGKIVSIWTREFPDKENSSYKWLGLPNSELIPNKPIAWVENLNRECCVVTEGVTDAIAFLKADIPAVALLGKEVSEANRVYFERAKAKLYFAFDADAPGEKASYELSKEFKGYILDLKSDKDPDEVLAQLGIEEFKKLVERAIKEAEYYLDAMIEKEGLEGIEEVLREISTLKRETEKDIWLKKLADKHWQKGVTQSSLRRDLRNIEKEKQKKEESESSQSTPQPEPLDLLAESKPPLHPAMDLIDGNLYFGTSSGDNSFLIYNRQVLNILEILNQYELTGFPIPLRFSVNGIKTYHKGGEIRGAKLYTWIYEFLSKYIVFKAKWQIVATVLWVIGTYLHRCFDLYPYLWIQSPTKRCGKTLFLEILAEMCFNSKGVETAPTEAVLFREPAITAGTLCWDEAEGLNDDKKKGERNSILNVAFRKGGKVSRCEGEFHEVKDYEVFRPTALAGISSLPDTAADRSLKIELIRKRKDEKVERMKLRRLRPEFQSLRDTLHIFALERAPKIIEAYEEFPDNLIPEVDDRLCDIFEVLFSLACGLFYYDKESFPPILASLQEAAKALSGVRNIAEGDISFIQAIQIIKSELDKRQEKSLILRSEEAVRLFQNGGIEWVVEPKHARGLLRKLGFWSAPHRVKEEFVRGYKIALEEIEDLSARYDNSSAEGK
jgi:DNA primase